METNNLPEFAFIDGNSHLGDLLENRTLILHLPSRSIFECIYCGEDSESDVEIQNDTLILLEFEYTNIANELESYLLISHFTDLDGEELNTVLNRIEIWLINYFDWEDHNSITNIQSSLN